jgi:hypothetical protein
MFTTGLVMVTESIDGPEMDVHANSFDEAIDLLQNRVETTVSDDPLRVSITLRVETASFAIVLDDDMNVVDFDRSPRTDAVTS